MLVTLNGILKKFEGTHLIREKSAGKGNLVLMERKVITEAELIEWMNNELHKVEDFKDCKFTSVLRLADKDEIGCNWSDPNIRCGGTDNLICEESAKKIVSKAREIFSIE
jgi:hypothetical protein